MTPHPMSCHCPDCTRYIPPEDIGKAVGLVQADADGIVVASFIVTADGIIRRFRHHEAS